MKRLVLFFMLPAVCLSAQTIEQCRQRFATYLNFRGSLNHRVAFEKDALYLLNEKGQRQFAVYAHELSALSAFFENSSIADQEKLVKQKGLKKFSTQQCDSLQSAVGNRYSTGTGQRTKPLQGVRIALDPGHFGTTLADARVEQKFLYFVKDSAKLPNDSIKLFESNLTFNTATLLRHMLEEQGAQVFVTRQRADHTSFGCTYADWQKHHKQRTLDSLKHSGQLTPEKYNRLNKCTDYTFFWEFFRDYDLVNRANVINGFKPHLTAVIHYNVDEKNDPWKRTSSRNYCMAFIGGAFTRDNLEKQESRLNFLRMLITDQLNRSEHLAELTVTSFSKNLNIAIAAKKDAEYLTKNCNETSSHGVYCRNLLLCRKINSVMVYGESLYQDNEYEAGELMRYDKDLYGVSTNNRLINVAKSYYDALLQVLKND